VVLTGNDAFTWARDFSNDDENFKSPRIRGGASNSEERAVIPQSDFPTNFPAEMEV
jgi:hypothetical protein